MQVRAGVRTEQVKLVLVVHGAAGVEVALSAMTAFVALQSDGYRLISFQACARVQSEIADGVGCIDEP